MIEEGGAGAAFLVFSLLELFIGLKSWFVKPAVEEVTNCC